MDEGVRGPEGIRGPDGVVIPMDHQRWLEAKLAADFEDYQRKTAWTYEVLTWVIILVGTLVVWLVTDWGLAELSGVLIGAVAMRLLLLPWQRRRRMADRRKTPRD